MNNLRQRLSMRLIAFSLVCIVAVALITQKANELSADPVGEKECPPLFPAAAGDPSKPFRIEVKTPATLPWAQQGGFINDASCLNKTAVYGIVRVQTVDDIKQALQFARDNGLKVSIAGVRHSMGGQAFAPHALVLDIMQFKQMTLDESRKTLTVQSGATWHDIQNYLHPKYAVKAMQSTDIFTVGGSIAVNAHGMDHQVGALGKTIRAMRVMLADGTIKNVSRAENAELFNLVVGGYGLFGVILDVELEISDNVVYHAGRHLIDYQAFPALFQNELAANQRLGLFYGHLSTSPDSLLQEMILYTYEAQPVGDVTIPPLGEVSSVKLRRLVLNASKLGSVPMRFKWFAEKNIEPRLESCAVVSRNQAMRDGEACLVSRNEPMHDSVFYLKNNLRNETDILHEYFIPREQLIAFVDGLRKIVTTNEVNLLNASVRVVHPEDNFLNYAPSEMFAIVLYINQETNAQGHAQMRKVTGELIDLTTQLKGRFFLPYQLHYTPQQLEASYPEIRAFFAAKRRYDPQGVFTNTWYERYAKSFE